MFDNVRQLTASCREKVWRNDVATDDLAPARQSPTEKPIQKEKRKKRAKNCERRDNSEKIGKTNSIEKKENMKN